MTSRLVVPVLFLAWLQAMPSAGAQNPAACVPPSGVPPDSITVTSTSPSVTVRWHAVSGATGYLVSRRDPDGSCWSLTPLPILLTSIDEPSPVNAGTYQYQVTVLKLLSTTGVSQYVPFTVAAPTVASRSFSLAGFTVAGTTGSVASRTYSTAGFTVVGTTASVASRTYSTSGFTVVGTTASVASRTYSTAGFTVVGTTASVASRTYTTAGFTVTGTTATVATRAFNLTGFTVKGTQGGGGKKKP